MRTFFVLASATIALAACGGATTEPTTPASSNAATPAGSSATAAPTAWQHGMSKDQQIAIMKQRVMPAMSKVFKEHDATKYAEFSCKTCHGPGPGLPEPREVLPHLTLKDGELTAFQEKPEIAKWMAEKVSPAMAEAMGMKPYDPKTHEGFGCGNCHAIDK